MGNSGRGGGMEMTTLAALLGHSKLNMVMRYAHPQERHQADAMKKLAVFNAAEEIAEGRAREKPVRIQLF
jgi:hypothetical protein